ncbi:MAG TPA: RNA 2',3'-cyclic phosphodiesterase [Thermoplasmata archaeon]|jgi:2'-5' RNA ligase
MSFRAFISVDLPTMPNVVELAEQLRRAGDSLKVVHAERLHLTLKFLGDTQEGLVPEIIGIVHEACAGVAPFAIRVRGTGAFPSLSRMNVLWVGTEGAEPLVRIAGILDDKMEALGYEREGRPWTAHVTLARVKGRRGLDLARDILVAHREDVFGEVSVEEVRLKKSVLTPQGPVYSTVDAVRLGA